MISTVDGLQICIRYIIYEKHMRNIKSIHVYIYIYKNKYIDDKTNYSTCIVSLCIHLPLSLYIYMYVANRQSYHTFIF